MNRRLLLLVMALVGTAGVVTAGLAADVTVEQNEGGSRAILATTGAGNIRAHPR